jgi:hypothetical protein
MLGLEQGSMIQRNVLIFIEGCAHSLLSPLAAKFPVEQDLLGPISVGAYG